MEGSVLTKVVLPIALGVVMLGLGLSLQLADFARAVKQPKAVIVGLLCQLVLLPALGFAIAGAFGLASGIAIGLVILSLCPGGVTSNVFSFLSRGDLALSITLTAITSLVTPFTIPLLAGIAFKLFGVEGSKISLPILKTIGTLVLITIVPVSIGMAIRAKAPGFAKKSERPVSILSLLFLILIIAGVIRNEWNNIPGYFLQAGWAGLTLNLVSMGIGFGLGLILKLRRAESITIGIEVGIQNGTTALFITSTLLESPEMSIAPAIYSLLMFGTGALFGVLVNIGRPKEAANRVEDSADID
ncbi:MAG: bile acid:sodium symporter family protein [Myxococcota bacterium]